MRARAPGEKGGSALFPSRRWPSAFAALPPALRHGGQAGARSREL